jgi:hypothetical protein
MFLHKLLTVLVQIAYKMGLQQKNSLLLVGWWGGGGHMFFIVKVFILQHKPQG